MEISIINLKLKIKKNYSIEIKLKMFINFSIETLINFIKRKEKLNVIFKWIKY
jgi:hypothetical protein